MALLAQYNTLGFYSAKAARQWDKSIEMGADYETYRVFFQTNHIPAFQLIVSAASSATVQLMNGNDTLVGTAKTVTVEAATGFKRLIYLGETLGMGTTPSVQVTNGALYNGYTVLNASPLFASNAHIPTATEWHDLIIAVGTSPGDKLKDTESWTTGDGIDTYGFAALASGYRDPSNNAFADLGTRTIFLSSEQGLSDYVKVVQMRSASSGVDEYDSFYTLVGGYSIRLIVDTPTEISGSNAIYVGNDLRRYNCKLMPDGKWWTVQNIAETKYRDGNTIPIVETAYPDWDELVTGGMCYYDNDIENATDTVLIPFDNTLPDGDYSLKVTNGSETYYSDIFGWTSDSDNLNDLLKISCVSSNIRLGRNYLLNLTGFTFECYLNALYLGINPEFEEEVSQKDGTNNVLYGNLVNQRQWDIDGCEYILRFLLGLRVLESNGTVTVTWKGVSYTANDIMAEKTEDHFTELMQVKLSFTDISEIVSVYNEIN